MLIGIEGPVLAGKSTIIAETIRQSALGDTKVGSVECYVAFALQHSIEVPSAISKDVTEAVDNLEQFSRLDDARITTHPDLDAVLLDRTPATLLAHSIAIRDLGAANVVESARALLRRSQAKGHLPHLSFYVSIEHSSQILRAKSRPSMPDIFLDPAFNEAFSKYFREQVRNPSDGTRYVVLDGQDAPSANAKTILDYIRIMLK